MSRWSKEQVLGVAGLMYQQAVGQQEIERASVDVVGLVKERMTEQLVRAAQTFAVDIDRGDLLFKTWEDNLFRGVVIRARWGPYSDKVRLEGGDGDGMVLTLPVSPSLGGSELMTHYSLDGWYEHERVWAYRYDPGSDPVFNTYH